MRKQIIAALFSLCPLLAEAADWYKFNENEERVDLVDRSTVVRKGTHVTSWSKVKFRVPQVYKGGEAAGALYSSAMQFADFDCARRAIYIIAANYFEGSDVDGSLTYSEKPIPGEQPYFVPVAPDSIGEAWMKYVCSSANRKDE
jgi:hypothetical protein